MVARGGPPALRERRTPYTQLLVSRSRTGNDPRARFVSRVLLLYDRLVRLLSIDLAGFRRFAELQTLETDGALTAIVGPNEAGKTSILDALARLDNPAPVPLSDLAGRTALPADHVVIAAVYALDDDDRQAIAHLHSSSDKGRARLLEVRLRASGWVDAELHGGLVRDTKPRHEARQSLQRLARAKWLPAEIERDTDAEGEVERSEDEEPEDSFARIRSDALDALAAKLDSTEQSIEVPTSLELGETASALRSLEDDRGEREALILEAAVASEMGLHPNDEASSTLLARRPRFLTFGESERDLRSEYDLSRYDDLGFTPEEGEGLETLPAPLGNLARLAQLDLRELVRLIGEDDSASYISLIDRANARLAKIFEAWSQGRVTVRIEKMDGYTIRLHVSEPTGGWTQLQERSDGLKMFVSLVSLTEARSEPRPPVILIDEIERHLHYDAQADLIQVFSAQTSIPQIIYTTHSAGCLPEDLGDGVRVVELIDDKHESRITNRFWSHGSGFGPLLIGMGASTLAFIPVRKAVMSEGATELVLLPRLLREATERRTLGYQIAPASSEAPAAHIAGLDLQGLGVAWVVDGDAGGDRVRKRLRKRHIPDENIVSLGGAESGLVLEDCLDVDVYVRAVNAELERSGHNARLTSADLTSENRPRALNEWARKKGITCPTKIDVANRVLDQKKDFELTDKSRRSVLRDLDSWFVTFFGLTDR